MKKQLCKQPPLSRLCWVAPPYVILDIDWNPVTMWRHCCGHYVLTRLQIIISFPNANVGHSKNVLLEVCITSFNVISDQFSFNVLSCFELAIIGSEIVN